MGASTATGSQRTAKEKPYFVMRDEHKSVYAASATPLPNVKISPEFDYDMDSDDASGENKQDHRGGNNPLNMPGY